MAPEYLYGEAKLPLPGIRKDDRPQCTELVYTVTERQRSQWSRSVATAAHDALETTKGIQKRFNSALERTKTIAILFNNDHNKKFVIEIIVNFCLLSCTVM